MSSSSDINDNINERNNHYSQAMPGFSIVRPAWATPRPTQNFNFESKEYPKLPKL
jgi:hypothetical protein